MSLDYPLPSSMFGLQATFYKGQTPIFDEDNLTELQDFYTVSQPDLDWGDRPPGTDIPEDNFSAVFAGKLVADQTGDYTLYLNTGGDEGVRLYAGEELLLDTWDTPASGERQVRLALNQGEAVDLRLEYREETDRAALKLEWEADGIAREVIPTQNLIRHGYGVVNEDDLLLIRVATDGNNDFELIADPTLADYSAIGQHTFSSIQAAVDQAEALMNTGQGVKILIEPGDYRVSDYGQYGIVLGNEDARMAEQLELNDQGQNATLVLEGTEPGVRILGSQQWQDGWEDLGNGVYRHKWTEDWGFEAPNNGRPPADPITHRREMVFIDGTRLDPVLFQPGTYDRATETYTFDRAINPIRDLARGQFTVDEESNSLYLRLPEGARINRATIEVAQAEQLFRSREPNSNLVLRNLEFAHAANRYHRSYALAAVDIGGVRRLSEVAQPQNVILDNVDVSDNSGTGLRLRYTNNVTVRESNFERNGSSGISTIGLDGALFHDIDAQYNNWRGNLGNYRGWSVAGIKNLRGQNITADNFNASYNYAHGYWHDENVKNTLFINGIAEYNSRHGIFIEVSDGPHQVIDSISRNNGSAGFMINTSPNVFLQGNYIADNGSGQNFAGEDLNNGVDTGDGEIRVGARIDREEEKPELPDIVDNITWIDNIIENTSDRTDNELVAIYSNVERYQNLLENELVTNYNVYWDANQERVFDQNYNRNLAFSELNNQGDRWLDVSNRDGFEQGSLFEVPKGGDVAPTYTGSFRATLNAGRNTQLTVEQLALSDPDTYLFDLRYFLANVPKYGTLRLRGVRLNRGDSFSMADVARGWVSYSHEVLNQPSDTLELKASDGITKIENKRLRLTLEGIASNAGNIADSPPPVEPEFLSPVFAPNPPELVTHFELNETAGRTALDSSALNADRTGTLIGDPQWGPGISQGGLLFDGGADALHFTPADPLRSNDYAQRSVSLWVNAEDSALSSDRRQVIYEEGDASRGLNMYLDNDQLYVGGWNREENGSEDDMAWEGTWLSTDQLLVGEWNHVTLVLDASDSLSAGALRGYLNGQAFGVGVGSELGELSGSLGVGNLNGSTRFHDDVTQGEGLIGAIDEVRIFDQALTDIQVQNLMLMPF